MTVTTSYLTPGAEHGRTGRALAPKGVVVHWVANPGSTALNNRKYFENGAGGNYTSAHYIIGLDGEILELIPPTECAQHAGKSYGEQWNEMAKYNNSKLIGIECCHPDTSGKFSDKTTKSLTELVRYLCERFMLDSDKDVYRHYDVCGKNCPAFYVQNPAEWDKLKAAFKPEDKNAPADWAKAAWDWGKKNGITDGTRPKDNITRQEVIQLLFNFSKKLL